MARVYELRLSVSPGVTAEQLLAALSRWINSDPGNDFSEVLLSGIVLPATFSCNNADLTAVRALIDERVFTAVRLQEKTPLSPPPLNANPIRHCTEFLLEESSDGCFFTLRLDQSLTDPAQAAAVAPLSLPTVLRFLSEQSMLAPDGGLPVSFQALPVTPQLDKVLQSHRLGTAFSSRPLLLIREGNFALTPKLIARLSQFLHILLLPAIHPALSALGAGGAQLLFPRLKWSRVVDLTTPGAAEDLVDWACRLTTLAVPGDLPSFDRLQAAGDQARDPVAAYLCVNRRLAESVLFYRVKNGLTQSELAQKAGTTGLVISRLENGRPARVQGSLIEALETALHLTNRELFSCEGVSAEQEAPPARPAFCPNCGTKTGDQGQFCPTCGNKLL